MKAKWVLSSMVMMLLAGCAMNRDLVMLNDKAERMERDLRQRQDMLQSKTDETSARQEDTFRTQHAEMRVNVERMRDELRAMTGRLEELEHIVRGRDATGGRSAGERTGRIDKMEEMLNANLQGITRLEDYVGLEPTRVASPAMDALGLDAANLNEEQLYELARGYFNQGNMEKAREGFVRLLKEFSKSKYAGNAQFWIGETFYQEKWYEKAILEYQKVIEQYPGGNKLQAALLKQGLAFHLLGENANARLILRELIRKYPNSSEAKIADQKLKDIK